MAKNCKNRWTDISTLLKSSNLPGFYFFLDNYDNNIPTNKL